jgi:hypothetical protein
MSNINVRIIGKHPHSGEKGYIESKDEMIDVHNVFGTNMYKIVLEDCPHMVDACFAELKNLELIDVPQRGIPVGSISELFNRRIA